MRDVERRLTKLEEVTPAPMPDDCVLVFYDAATGKPQAPIPPTATTLVWVPDNKRGQEDGNKY